MKIGIPREIKDGETRVALTPDAVSTLKKAGHAVFVETKGGERAGFSDGHYRKAGAEIVSQAAVWKNSSLVVKVKEPQKLEFKYLSKDKILLSYLHLAAEPAVTQAMVRSGMTGIASETIEDAACRLPLLEPMSEIAGRMAVIVAAYFQSASMGGAGILIPGLPGVLPARVVIVGGGTVGENAAKVAAGMGAQVTILDKLQQRLRKLDEILPENVSTLISTPGTMEEAIASADVIIGAVLIPGAKAPKLITEKMIRKIKHRAIFIDVCIDQGGISETSRLTSHSKPTYLVGNVLHYCVPNMPGSYGRSATLALSNALTPYVLKLGNKGLHQAFKEDRGFLRGLNVYEGRITYEGVAEAQRLAFTDPQDLFA